MPNKTHLLALSQKEIADFVVKNGAKPFVGKQIMEWIYQKKIIDPLAMSNIPKKIQQALAQDFECSSFLVLKKRIESPPETFRLAFESFDGHIIESILMPNSKGSFTLCVSSQVGCSLACDFCATGKMGLKRDLFPFELSLQFLVASQIRPISNVVFMGMGEPFLNDNLEEILERFISETYFNLGARKITISTAGMIEYLPLFAKNFPQVKLAWSFHSSNEQFREQLLPIVSKMYSLNQMIEAFMEYQSLTKKRITLEYTLIKGFNDTREEVAFLKTLSYNLDFLLNVIPYNSHDLSKYQTPSKKDVYSFCALLEESGIKHTIRRSLGPDIFAACGQLASEMRD